MKDVEFVFRDHNKLIIDTDRGTIQEMSEEFSFLAEGYKFHPSFKQGRWDGKIKLIHSGTQTAGVGLLPDLIRFCRTRNYTFAIDDELKPSNDSNLSVDEFITDLKLPFAPFDYQMKAIKDCLKYHRLVVQSPTGSGKSLIIYSLIRWLQANDKKILLIVPNISLLSQMSSDVNEYSVNNGWDAEENLHLVKAGVEKSSDKTIVISTWQSLQKEDRAYFDQYDAVMVDEAHMARATAISQILNNCNAPYRFAFSGTIDGGKYVNRLTIQSLFGSIINTTTTRELIDDGKLTDTSIKCILLKHKVKMKKVPYQDEIKHLLEHEKRNALIVKLALNSSKKGNTLVLFNVIDHGKKLAEMINDATDGPVFYIAGEIKGTEREEIRKMMETQTNAILVASYGTLSIGVNIPSLAALIFTHPTKSMIRVLQSIGRILRKSDHKQQATVIDIADDLSGGRASKNHTLKHFLERVSIYSREKFNYSLKELEF